MIALHIVFQQKDFLIYEDAIDLCEWRKLPEFDYIKDTGIQILLGNMFLL